jgi:hypothetical protein
MRQAKFLNKSEDLNWLFITHLKDFKHIFEVTKSFILIGNANCPELIELYDTKEIYLGQKPILTVKDIQKNDNRTNNTRTKNINAD